MAVGRLKTPLSLTQIGEILTALGIEFRAGGPDIECDKLCSIKHIEEGGLYFLTRAVERDSLGIRRSIIVTDERVESLADTNAFILVDRPQPVFYELCRVLVGDEAAGGIDPTAIVDPRARVDRDVTIGAHAVIGKCEIGWGAHIHPHVVLYDNSVIGRKVTVEAGTCIGATGLAWAWDTNGERFIQPQTGGVFIDDDCFLGTNISICRGSLNEFTSLGRGTLVAHGTRIGHGVVIGDYCHLANGVTLAGNVVIGARSFLGSGSVVSSNVRISPGTVVGAGAVVVKHVEEENTVVAGVPAVRIGRASGSHKGVPHRPW